MLIVQLEPYEYERARTIGIERAELSEVDEFGKRVIELEAKRKDGVPGVGSQDEEAKAATPSGIDGHVSEDTPVQDTDWEEPDIWSSSIFLAVFALCLSLVGFGVNIYESTRDVPLTSGWLYKLFGTNLAEYALMCGVCGLCISIFFFYMWLRGHK